MTPLISAVTSAVALMHPSLHPLQISHGNTARHALEHGDDVLAKICGKIASDEGRHELAYCRCVCARACVLVCVRGSVFLLKELHVSQFVQRQLCHCRVIRVQDCFLCKNSDLCTMMLEAFSCLSTQTLQINRQALPLEACREMAGCQLSVQECAARSTIERACCGVCMWGGCADVWRWVCMCVVLLPSIASI